jgi:NADPH:quinone reductase-like Zn-dependent oxidoreductase
MKTRLANLAACLLSMPVATVAAAAVGATPATQQAIVQVAYGGPEVLQMQTVPVLAPGPNQVLIRVYAAALNPTDWYMRRDEPGYTTVPVPVVPGGDVAGVVQQLGSGVTGFSVGDPVFAVISRSGNNVGNKGVRLNGGYAHYVVAEAGNVMRKPRALTFVQAAGMALAPITGVRAVVAAELKKGDRLLITGVSGAVGSAAVVAAKARGVYVIGTASPRHQEYLQSIGVDEVIDYTQGRFEDKVRAVDAVLDTVGGDNATRAMTVLKKGGRMQSTARGDLAPMCTAAGVVCVPRAPAHGQPRSVLDEVSRLLESGQLRARVDRTYPLSQAAAAQQYGEQGAAQGKIVLVVDASRANTR